MAVTHRSLPRSDAAAAGTEAGDIQRPPPLLLRGVKQNHLAKAAAMYTRERQKQTLDDKHVPTAAGPEEFHMLVLALRHLLVGCLRKPAGQPPSTLESEAAFRWAHSDVDGSLSIDAFVAAQAVSRKLNEQWEGRQAAEGKRQAAERRARHTAASRGKYVTKSLLAVEQQLALEKQQPSRWPDESGRASLLPSSSPLVLTSKWRSEHGTFGSASHSTPAFSFNPLLRPPVK